MSTSDKSSKSPNQGNRSSISYHDTENVMENSDEDSKESKIIQVPNNEYQSAKFFPRSPPEAIDLDDIEIMERPQETHEEMIAFLEKRIQENKDGEFRKKKEQAKLQEYLFKTPPNFNLAKKHGKAMRVRISEPEAVGDEEKQWIDCKRVLPEYTRELPLWSPMDELIEHGDGFPLLFQFLGFLILFFTTIFLFQGIYFIIVLMIERDNNSINLVNLFSVSIIVEKDANGDHETSNTLLTIYIILTFLTNILIIVIVCIFWVKQQKLKNTLDLDNLTDADFALVLYNLPSDILNGQLRSHIVQTAGIENNDIIYLNRLYEYDKILKLKKEQFKWLQLKTDLEAFRAKLERKGENSEGRYPKRVGLHPWKKFPPEEEIDRKIEETEEELLDDSNTHATYCGKTIVVCRNEQIVEKIVDAYSFNIPLRGLNIFSRKLLCGWVKPYEDPEEFMINNKRVFATRAPEPGDLIWENVHVSHSRRYWITALTFLICLLLLIPCYFLIIFLYQEKSNYAERESGSGSSIFATLLEVLITLWVAGVNIIIEIYILIFSSFERQPTNSYRETSLLYKVILLKFLNACLIPILSNTNEDEWFNTNGLVSEVILIVVILNLSEIFRLTFNIIYLYKRVLRWYFERKGEKAEITQKQANWLYENDPTDFSKTLGVICVFIMSILFYSPIVPGLTIYGIIGSVILFYVLKVLIIRRKIIRKNISANLVVHSGGIFKFAVLGNSICTFFFFPRLLNNPSITILLNFILGIAFCVLPVRWAIFKIFGINDDNDEEGEYEDCMHTLKHYDVQNPITTRAGNSRINGRTLKDGIARGILKKLKRTAVITGEVSIEDVQTNELGVNGFGLLLNKHKEQVRNDRVMENMNSLKTKNLKAILARRENNSSDLMNDAGASYKDNSGSDED